MTLSAGGPPPGCSKTSVRQYLILNARKIRLIGNNGYLIDNITRKYKN